jgi:exonuclease III
LKEAKFKRNPKRLKDYIHPHPATLHTADIVIDGDTWATIVGAYGFMPDSKNGWDAALGIVNECVDLLDSGNERVILAGDFNLWPKDILPVVENNLGMVDIMGFVEDLPELKDAVGGSRIWTHKNGNSPNAARQELDFIFTTDELADEVSAVGGGVSDFPDAWDVSDHAPVVVVFED